MLRLEKHVWSTVKFLRKPTKEYAHPPKKITTTLKPASGVCCSRSYCARSGGKPEFSG